MEKTVPNNKHSRRHSTGNLMLDLTGYEDVLSRYLRPPVPSCHDNCKPHQHGFDQPTRKIRSNKITNAADRMKHIPRSRSPTKHVKIRNTSLPKAIKPQLPSEFKRQADFKSNSTSDPFYIPPSRITRRYSDVNLPTTIINVTDQHNGLEDVTRSVRSNKKINSKPARFTPGDGTKVQASKTLHSSRKPKLNETGPSNGTSIGVTKKAENTTRGVRLRRQDDHDFASQKLNFWQGNTVGSQSDSSSPRKLKFAQGKVLDVNQNVEGNGKSLRRLSSGRVVLQTPESNSVSVALKSCDMEVNKGHTRLNHVIEETASRLIQTRKSKVQALVGAFEMISANEF